MLCNCCAPTEMCYAQGAQRGTYYSFMAVYAVQALPMQDPENFERDMMGMFDTLDPDTISEHTSDIIASMMELVRALLIAIGRF